MAHSPAVLAAYAAIRQATAAHGTLDAPGPVGAHAGHGRRQPQRLRRGRHRAPRRGGRLEPGRGLALRDGESLGDDKIDSLVAVVREAAARAGQVGDLAWQRAVACGWTSEELAEAFAYLGLTDLHRLLPQLRADPAGPARDPAPRASAG